MTTSLLNKPFSLAPRNFSEAIEFAKLLADSTVVPRPFQGKPGDILVAIQMGSELGLQPMQALQNITVLNGRPCLWGDSMLAVVKAHPDFEYIKEYEENGVAICKLKRKDQPEHTSTFSQEDAKLAGLAGKSGPWLQYPKRMRQMRARSFALRDVFPDALRGLQMVEEVQDIPATNREEPATKSPLETVKTKLGIAKQEENVAEAAPVVNSTPETTKDNEAPPVTTFEEVKSKLQAAQTMTELEEAVELAKHLPEDKDKTPLRKAYRAKLRTLLQTAK